jgi:hypothetical protein
MLTRYAMLGFELCEELGRWADAAILSVCESLADALYGICTSGNIKQLLRSIFTCGLGHFYILLS